MAEHQDEEAGQQDQSVMRIGKRCFVGNLAWKTSWQDLKDTFRDAGTVVYANVMRDDNGRSGPTATPSGEIRYFLCLAAVLLTAADNFCAFYCR